MINNNIHDIIEHLSFLIDIKAHSNVNYRKINNFSLICNNVTIYYYVHYIIITIFYIFK